MIVNKKLCSEGQADAEHTYFYWYDCPKCDTRVGNSLKKEHLEKCPNCNTKLEYED